MSTTSTSASTATATPTTSKAQNRTGEYSGVVSLSSVILTGDRPAIFTRVKLTAADHETEGLHVTHVVRLKTKNPAKTAQAIQIGINELRAAFPNELALLNTDRAVIQALIAKKIVGKPVNVSIVQQMKNNIPVRLANADGSPGELAFNVRLRPSEVMSEEVSSKLLDAVLTSPAPEEAKPANPFVKKD